MTLSDLFTVSTAIPSKTSSTLSLAEKLYQVKSILDDAGIPFFLLFGTCLGAVRESGVIDHDDDIDIGVYEWDMSRLASMVPDLEAVGIYLEEVCLGNLRFVLSEAEGVLDVWLLKPIKNPFYRLLGKKWWVEHALVKQDYYSPDIVNMTLCEGEEYRIPANELMYLEAHYGHSWHTPQKDVYARYRPLLSRVINRLFIDADVPLEYSGDEKNNTFKPWASRFLKRFFPNATLTQQFKHPETQ